MTFTNASVLIVGKKNSLNQALIDYFNAQGADILQYQEPINSQEDANQLIKQVVRSNKKIDVLINCHLPQTDGSLLDFDEGQIRQIIDQHLMATIFCCKSAIEQMSKQGHGRIINTVLPAGVFGMAQQAIISASSAGIIGFSKSLSLEYKPNIKINTVSPLFVEADNKSQHSIFQQYPDIDERLYDSKLVVPVVAYLAHRTCQITGKLLSVTGSRVAHVFRNTVPGYFYTEESFEEIDQNLDLILDTNYAMTPDDCRDELLMIEV